MFCVVISLRILRSEVKVLGLGRLLGTRPNERISNLFSVKRKGVASQGQCILGFVEAEKTDARKTLFRPWHMADV